MILLTASASLAVEGGGRDPFSCHNGGITGCHARSASTWDYHGNSSHRTGQVTVSRKGPSDKGPQVSIHHSLLFPELTPVLLDSGFHGHTMVLVSATVCALATHGNA